MRHTILSFSFLLFLLSFSSPASAWDDFLGVRPMGMGGAHSAVVTGNDAIFLNPAGMALFRRYSFETQYLLTPEFGIEGGPMEHVFNVSVVDNQITPVATGISYTRIERDDSKRGNRYDMAFGYALGQNLMIGTNVKYLNYEREGREDLDAVTMDFGMLMRFDFGVTIGLVGYNLTNTGDYLEHPISMAAAVSFSPFRTLSIAFDWMINFQKPDEAADALGEKGTGYAYRFGAEYLLMDQLLLRAGAVIDQTRPENDQYGWSAGIGYITKTFGIGFSYQQSFEHSWDGTFGVGLRLHML